MTAASYSLRDTLKTATADDHAAIDHAAARWHLHRPSDYRAFLTAQARALIPVEDALAEAGVDRLLPDWPERARKERLLSDLSALGARMSAPLEKPRYAGPAEIWGALYVLEGSRLGARLLLRQVQAGSETSSLPCAFLSHGGNGMWRSFLEKLENSEARDNPAAAVSGARMTFALFAQAFGAASLEGGSA